MVKGTGWLKGLEVTAGGTGIVLHAGLALLRALAGKTGLTVGLSRALASDRLLVHEICYTAFIRKKGQEITARR
jgi:hypothetical protein